MQKPSEATWAAVRAGWEACLPPEPALSAPLPSLSGMNLLSEHLDPKLLSRLKQLQELDLSNNQLETLPANLGLSHLRILRCANNQLGDVTVLCQFPQLEELSLEGNPFLTVRGRPRIPGQHPGGSGSATGWGDPEPLSSLIPQVSDNLKVSFLLPKLRKVNGKDASSTCSQVENLNRELTSRVRGGAVSLVLGSSRGP